jgi:hypothetical protein
MRIKTTCIFCFVAFVFLFSSSFQNKKNVKKSSFASVKITFNNVVKDSRIVLFDSLYTNPFGEKYSINKFRYYVSDVSLKSDDKDFNEKESFYLVDESKIESQSIYLSVPQANYFSINFLLGVDSLHNVSGAQSGALDPTKDMFWTWNTGYVMAKLEGNSTSSTLVNHKYEFHIGGFSGKYNVLKKIQLRFPKNKPIYLSKNKTTEIIINADVNAWWQDPNEIKIAEHANITAPGKWALALSDNYAKMFSIEKIISNN